MKDIIEEMRECLRSMDVLIPTGYVPNLAEVADWADRLESMQPAAGPWRTDVENAPRDVQLVCWQWTPKGNDWHCIGMKLNQDGTWECGEPGCLHQPPIAFAELNHFAAEAP